MKAKVMLTDAGESIPVFALEARRFLANTVRQGAARRSLQLVQEVDALRSVSRTSVDLNGFIPVARITPVVCTNCCD